MHHATIETDGTARKLRRVGRLARRRMRIDGDDLTNGVHTDGTLSVEITGLGAPVAGIPETFEWVSNRPVALVIVRSGIDGEDVAFDVGPSRRGVARAASIGDGSGIRYVAFCYDAAPAASGAVQLLDRSRRADRPLGPTRRDRRSILELLLQPGTLGRLATRGT